MLSKKMTFSLMSLNNITCFCFHGSFCDGGRIRGDAER